MLAHILRNWSIKTFLMCIPFLVKEMAPKNWSHVSLTHPRKFYWWRRRFYKLHKTVDNWTLRLIFRVAKYLFFLFRKDPHATLVLWEHCNLQLWCRHKGKKRCHCPNHLFSRSSIDVWDANESLNNKPTSTYKRNQNICSTPWKL